MELERKFLVKSRPRGLRVVSASPIRQGYFYLRNKEVEIRLREKGPECFITIKAGRGRSRLEEEIHLSKRQFEKLWPLVRSACVIKTRYRIPYAGQTIELDIYKGRHRGLITAEVEFESRSKSESFQPPPWFGREITRNRHYANVSLAHRQRA